MEITYTPAVGSPVLVSGIFDAQFVLSQGDAETGVEATAPAFFCRLSSLPIHPDLDEPTLNIDGVNYHVDERRGAGLGSIVLVLRRVV